MTVEELSTPGGARDEDLIFIAADTMVGPPTQPRTMARLINFYNLVNRPSDFRIKYWKTGWYLDSNSQYVLLISSTT